VIIIFPRYEATPGSWIFGLLVVLAVAALIGLGAIYDGASYTSKRRLGKFLIWVLLTFVGVAGTYTTIDELISGSSIHWLVLLVALVFFFGLTLNQLRKIVTIRMQAARKAKWSFISSVFLMGWILAGFAPATQIGGLNANWFQAIVSIIAGLSILTAALLFIRQISKNLSRNSALLQNSEQKLKISDILGKNSPKYLGLSVVGIGISTFNLLNNVLDFYKVSGVGHTITYWVSLVVAALLVFAGISLQFADEEEKTAAN
jgi:uncharacterized membrane protein YhdT